MLSLSLYISIVGRGAQHNNDPLSPSTIFFHSLPFFVLKVFSGMVVAHAGVWLAYLAAQPWSRGLHWTSGRGAGPVGVVAAMVGIAGAVVAFTSPGAAVTADEESLLANLTTVSSASYLLVLGAVLLLGLLLEVCKCRWDF